MSMGHLAVDKSCLVSTKDNAEVGVPLIETTRLPSTIVSLLLFETTAISVPGNFARKNLIPSASKIRFVYLDVLARWMIGCRS